MYHRAIFLEQTLWLHAILPLPFLSHTLSLSWSNLISYRLLFFAELLTFIRKIIILWIKTKQTFNLLHCKILQKGFCESVRVCVCRCVSSPYQFVCYNNCFSFLNFLFVILRARIWMEQLTKSPVQSVYCYRFFICQQKKMTTIL